MRAGDASRGRKTGWTRRQPAPGTSTTFGAPTARCTPGSPTDLARRCRQHNAGTAARYTRCRRPVSLVYHEAHSGRGAALRREAALKALSRREKEALVRLAGHATRTG